MSVYDHRRQERMQQKSHCPLEKQKYLFSIFINQHNRNHGMQLQNNMRKYWPNYQHKNS